MSKLNLNVDSLHIDAGGGQVTLQTGATTYNPTESTSLVTKNYVDIINSTATHTDGVVAIVTTYTNADIVGFYAPSDFSGDDTYTVNGSAVTLTDLNGNAIYDGWKEGAPVQLILKGTQAFFKSGGGVNDTLPPLNPNMTGEQADGVFTVTADKLPVAQADALAGAEWYYADHVPARPGDGTKVEFTREQLVAYKAAGSYAEGDLVKIKEHGAAVEFYVSKQDYESGLNGPGRVLIVRKDVFDNRAWDSGGVNAYAESDIDAWFNGDYKAKFSEAVQAMMGTTKFYYTPGNGNNTVGTLERAIFALSVTELGGITPGANNTEGSELPNAGTLKIAYDSSGSDVDQWTRSPDIEGIGNVIFMTEYGAANSWSCSNSAGARPAFTIPSTALFDPDTNELIEDAASGISTLADVQPLSGESISDEGTSVSVAIPWTESGYCYCRQFPYNSKHQYQTQLVGAVATNDPIYGISLDPVLENNSWAKIAEVSETGAAANVWQVGDTKDIVVGGETLTVEIVGFDHDDLADGSGKAGITFGLKNLMASSRQMNTTNTNAGGFTGSSMYDYLVNTVLPSLPEELQTVLKSVNKKTSAGNQSSTINTNAMKIFLFSEIEIFGSVAFSKSGEGSQYARFATASSRIKRRSNGSGAANWWWERSPRSGSSNYFCRVTNDGNAGNVNAGSSGGVAFGFCV